MELFVKTEICNHISLNEEVISLISVSMHEIKLKTINLSLLLPHFCATLTFQYPPKTELSKTQ